MTKEEFRKLSFKNIDDVVRISNEEACYAFDDVYQLGDDIIKEDIERRLKKYGVLNVKWFLEDIKSNDADSFVYYDGHGSLKDVDESFFDTMKEDLEKELEDIGFFEEEEEEEEEEE